jgi:hypothetical protein
LSLADEGSTNWKYDLPGTCYGLKFHAKCILPVNVFLNDHVQRKAWIEPADINPFLFVNVLLITPILIQLVIVVWYGKESS